jgi:peptide deformylase
MIVPSDHPILKQDCVPFDFENDDAKALFETLRDEIVKNRGVGLSAPQIGIPVRAFVIGNFSSPAEIIGVFNPIITDYSEEKVTYEEGCVSFPGMFIKISRPRSIRVRYAGWDGNMGATRYEGYTARVFQHEYDHLNGITFHQRANRYHLERARKFKAKIDRQLRFVA